MFLEDTQIDLPYSFDAITRAWLLHGFADQGVSLFVGPPSASPSALFAIDDHPDYAHPESESRFERVDDDAFSSTNFDNVKILREIRQFGIISLTYYEAILVFYKLKSAIERGTKPEA